MMALNPIPNGDICSDEPVPTDAMVPATNPACATINSPSPNPLHVSFEESLGSANSINVFNVLEYFCNRYNPFYDRSCNNEFIKMQHGLPLNLE